MTEPDDKMEGLQSLMTMTEEFLVLSDVAEGFKRSLLERGWSAEVAEEAGGEMLVGMIRQVYGQLLTSFYK